MKKKEKGCLSTSVLFCTNLPSPYRTFFFNELGKQCKLTVCYERKNASNRDKKWIGTNAITYEEVYLNLQPVGEDRSWGSELRRYIAVHRVDFLILTNYVSLACMEAIVYCKFKRIPYWIEYDGGFNRKEKFFKRAYKRFLLCGAKGHLTTCNEHIEYLQSLGIPLRNINKYPFSSVFKDEVVENPISSSERGRLRVKLGINEEKVIVSVGRFNYLDGRGKGFDLLFRIAERLNKDIGIYIIGGNPTHEFQKWKNISGLTNIHFVPFKTKKDLFEYYRAANIMVLLTRGDVWGLVVNEAMACALPVLTTDQCMAGVEMIQNRKNGYIVPTDSYDEALSILKEFFDDEKTRIALEKKSIETAKTYTIEEMAKSHVRIFEENK